MKRFKPMLMIACMLVLGVSFTAYAGIETSEVIRSATVSLSSTTKKATFELQAKVSCSSISVTSYTLYKSNGTAVTSGSLSAGSGSQYYKSVDLSGYISSGNSYYVSAVFNADGEIKSASSPTVSF